MICCNRRQITIGISCFTRLNTPMDKHSKYIQLMLRNMPWATDSSAPAYILYTTQCVAQHCCTVGCLVNLMAYLLIWNACQIVQVVSINQPSDTILLPYSGIQVPCCGEKPLLTGFGHACLRNRMGLAFFACLSSLLGPMPIYSVHICLHKSMGLPFCHVLPLLWSPSIAGVLWSHIFASSLRSLCNAGQGRSCLFCGKV